MKYSKKGSTLLEVLLYMSISLVISLMVTVVLMDVKQIYFKSIDKSINVNKIVEGFIIIDNLGKEEELIKVEINNDNIKFYYTNEIGTLVKELRKEENKLIIKYYKKQGETYITYGSPNDIIAGIEEFSAIKKGKLIYIKIKKEGEIYIKCI